MKTLSLTTDRLLMRPWRADDKEPYFAFNSEPAVYRYLGPLTRDRSDDMIDRANANFAEHGWGRWALEDRRSGDLIGHCGFMPVSSQLPFWPGIEIGWRLSGRWQGKGLATEAAREALRHGFEALGFERVLAYTTPPNTASWRLMERLGMAYVEAFDHPKLPEGHALRRHVLYELRYRDYAGTSGMSA